MPADGHNGTVNGASRKSGGTPKAQNVIVVGGSLGGLAAGIALKHLGKSVILLERNPSSHLQNQGAGIVAGGDTLAFFEKHDRCRRQLQCPSQKRMYLDKQGSVVHEVVMRQNMTSWDLSYYIMRANFDGVTSDYCEVPEARPEDGKAEYRYDHTVTKLEEEGDRVRVHFEHSDGSGGTALADIVVGADGPSSTVRKQFIPDVKREYAGYCALRGTIPEREASAEAREVFCERFTFFHADGIQILAYLIPGINGAIEPGHRLINFVWYHNFPADSQEFEDLMTDSTGRKHNLTLPPGKMDSKVWNRMKQVAEDRMPSQFAEIICKTKQPFAQAVTDVLSPINNFMTGKVLLIGDALAGFRPHTVASTSQAAYDAMLLADYVAGRTSLEDFVISSMQFARLIQKRGVEMGNRSQFGRDVPLKDHIADRDLASTPREKEVYPSWTQDDLNV